MRGSPGPPALLRPRLAPSCNFGCLSDKARSPRSNGGASSWRGDLALTCEGVHAVVGLAGYYYTHTAPINVVIPGIGPGGPTLHTFVSGAHAERRQPQDSHHRPPPIPIPPERSGIESLLSSW